MNDWLRFLKHVDCSDANGCWPWTGFTVQTDTGPRGRVGHEGTNQWAPRVAYKLFVGPLERHEFACHTCDNGICVRPSHLFPGTAAINNADKSAKGRAGPGVTSHTLTADDLATVRARLIAGDTTAAIARDFNLTRQAVSYHKGRLAPRVTL